MLCTGKRTIALENVTNEDIPLGIVSFYLKLSSSCLFMTDWFCVTLRTEAGIGGPGEETVLLDTVGIGNQHRHLLLVEKGDLVWAATG